MKKILVIITVVMGLFWTSCKQEKETYVDLRSGQPVKVEKDPVTGAWLNAETKEPLYIYVDTKKNDTIYGKTGAVIDGHVVKSDEVYWFDEDLDKKNEVKVNTGDYKIKTDGKKIKVEDGVKKVNYD